MGIRRVREFIRFDHCARYANRHTGSWDYQEDLYSSTVDHPHHLLVKPTSKHLQHNARSLLATAYAYKMPLDRCLVVHYNEKVELGELSLEFGGRTEYVQNTRKKD